MQLLNAALVLVLAPLALASECRARAAPRARECRSSATKLAEQPSSALHLLDLFAAGDALSRREAGCHAQRRARDDGCQRRLANEQ